MLNSAGLLEVCRIWQIPAYFSDLVAEGCQHQAVDYTHYDRIFDIPAHVKRRLSNHVSNARNGAENRAALGSEGTARSDLAYTGIRIHKQKYHLGERFSSTLTASNSG